MNPFTPTFGTVPLLFAGRQDIIDEVMLGIEEGPGSPNRACLFIGSRGSGKTALLLKLAEEAESEGWLTVQVTAAPDMLEEIFQRAEKVSAHVRNEKLESQITSLSAGGFGVTRTIRAEIPRTWRLRMENLLDELKEHGTGLVICVDEVDISIDELRHLVTCFQHFVGERREVMLLLAGLPYKVSMLLQDSMISFLRRAVHHHLGLIYPVDVFETMRNTVRISGRSIGKEALDRAVEATGGYPFLIQLIGYRMWQQSPDNVEISVDDVTAAIAQAQHDMETRIFDATLRELSAQDRKFLFAMLEDEKVSRIADLIERLGKSSSYVGQYRKRLMEQGIIGERGWGEVGFDLPMFREYLEKQRPA